MNRVILRTRAVSRKELSACRRVSSGMRQFSIVIRPFCTTLRAVFFLYFFDLESGGGFVLDDKGLDLVVGEVARPDDRDVAPRRIADPFLLAVEDPCIPVTLGPSGKAARGSRADERLR